MTKFNYEHAWTTDARVVTTSREEPYLGVLPVSSRILCPSHAAHAVKNAGDGCRREVALLSGRHVCTRCLEFKNTDHSALVRALQEPGAYTRQRGWNGAIGVVYSHDPSSPSGARSSGMGFDPFCPHAMETVKSTARVMEPPRP